MSDVILQNFSKRVEDQLKSFSVAPLNRLSFLAFEFVAVFIFTFFFFSLQTTRSTEFILSGIFRVRFFSVWESRNGFPFSSPFSRPLILFLITFMPFYRFIFFIYSFAFSFNVLSVPFFSFFYPPTFFLGAYVLTFFLGIFFSFFISDIR